MSDKLPGFHGSGRSRRWYVTNVINLTRFTAIWKQHLKKILKVCTQRGTGFRYPIWSGGPMGENGPPRRMGWGEGRRRGNVPTVRGCGVEVNQLGNAVVLQAPLLQYCAYCDNNSELSLRVNIAGWVNRVGWVNIYRDICVRHTLRDHNGGTPWSKMGWMEPGYYGDLVTMVIREQRQCGHYSN